MVKKSTQIIEPIADSFKKGASKLVKSNKDNKLRALYTAPLLIGDIELECSVLSDDTRIITATSVFTAFKRSRKGTNDRLEIEGTKLPPFIAAKNIKPFITKDILDKTKLIFYKDGGISKSGYDSLIIPEMCKVYLEARRAKSLTISQEKLAVQSEILLETFAKVGIIALIDEATGYQFSRKHDALRLLLNQYIEDGLKAWIKTFPDEFFVLLDKLYKNKKTTSRKRPSYYGHFINKYIYNPIENGYIKTELDKLNIKDNKKRKARFHQWLTEHGKHILTLQMGKIMAIMDLCKDITHFNKIIENQKRISIIPSLFEEFNDPFNIRNQDDKK